MVAARAAPAISVAAPRPASGGGGAEEKDSWRRNNWGWQLSSGVCHLVEIPIQEVRLMVVGEHLIAEGDGESGASDENKDVDAI